MPLKWSALLLTNLKKLVKTQKIATCGAAFHTFYKVLRKCKVPFLLAFAMDFQKAFENFCVLAPVKP